MIKRFLCWVIGRHKARVVEYGCSGVGISYRDMKCDNCDSEWTEEDYQ